MMNKKNILFAQILTYSGIIPFLLLGIAVIFHFNHLNYSLALFTYGGIILSFLCGIHWGIFLFFSQSCSRNLFIQSNAISLLGWLSILFGVSYYSVVLQVLCFLYLLILDLELYRNKVIPLWFFHIRRNATVVVSLLLIITACFS